MEDFLRVARQAAENAGRILLDYFRQERSLDFAEKARNDFVTRADREAESMIIATIRNQFPDHRFLAEESGASDGDGVYTWVIDPLDGTSNFVVGIPIFSVSIALWQGESPVLGLVFDPVLSEWFFAVKDQGAYLNGHSIRVSALGHLAGALGATGFPFRKHHLIGPYMKAFVEILEKCQDMRRCGSAALDLAYVACGRYDFFWEAHLQPWDFAAGRLLIEEAGGRVSNFLGHPLGLKPDTVVAGNPNAYMIVSSIIQKHFQNML